MYCNVDQWIEIRRRVLNREISKRQACQEYELHWQTLKKILSQPVPPERREPGPPRPSKLDPFRPALEAMLDSDRQSHRKQRHTAWRMFERLRDEHGYDGGYTLVKDAVRALKLSRKEVFLPLKHDPGEAQVDFGYCDVHLAGPKLARLSDDQGAFLPIPAQDFEARRVAPGQADSLSLVTFDRNQYSVPTQYAHRQVMIIAGIEDVRIVFEDRLIAQHRRCWDRDQTYFEPIHYLALLERKPGGFDFAKPLEGWELPVSFGILRRQLEADLGSRGTREFIKVLRLLERHSLSALKVAVETALELGMTSADAVRLIVDASQEPPIGLFSLDGRPQLKLVRVEQTQIAAYQSLLTTSVRTEVSP